ncbi:hypothetical protein J3R83DRAFT_12014 [Lanmaoa asiatica]|nr:hypothetical protein J3R83DRAFT_12014 [Lanmaoa asiatica]
MAQAIAKNPANSKALFRKGKALGELGYFEKAEVVLRRGEENCSQWHASLLLCG